MMTGQTLSHYRIHEEISRGGMGVVYRATDVRLNRDVAFKVLPEELTHDGERKRRFIQEAQAASALEHPHIAVIHEVDDVDGHSFIAMELIRGEKLSALLARQRLSATRVLELAAEIASGLGRAHEKGIVHRDLKPANVMITDEGHAKIIDFGIAKLIETFPGDTASETRTSNDTGAGVVLGTAAYMSPEQARGDRIDYRSDIFSFGVLLHEMLSGQVPFQGRSSIETAHAILHEPAPRLPSLGPGVAPDAAVDIQRLLDKCLAKDAGDRYQGMRDLVVDLRAARRRLESAPHPVVTAPRPLAWRAGLTVAALAVAAAVAMLVWSRSTPAGTGARPVSSKPSVAVLYFDNTTGTRELDWLRTGITEMVVTDLSQAADLEVIATDQLYEVMANLRRADDRVTSPEVIRAVAERTGVSNVIVGSYLKAGDAIRINVRLQEASTGRILSSERVDAPNEASLFAIVDELTQRIQRRFRTLRAGGVEGSFPLLRDPAAEAPAGLDRGLGEVTTSSIDAYKQYAEGINLHERHREVEAATLFEQAIAIDSRFAMAHAKLAVVFFNLGRWGESEKHATLALQNADRLTLRERFYIEGFYHSNRAAGSRRAIDAYKQCVDLNGGDQSCRHNLAVTYTNRQQWAEGIAQYEALLTRGSLNPTTTGNLTQAYRALGQFDKARAAAERFVARSPDNAAGHVYLGEAHAIDGGTDEAVKLFRKAMALDPTDTAPLSGIFVAHALREQWQEAEMATRELAARPQPTAQWLSGMLRHRLLLLRGSGAEALQSLERSMSAAPQIRSAVAAAMATNVLLARGDPSGARAQGERAVKVQRIAFEEPYALTALARALATAGRRAEADRVLARATRDPDTGESAWLPIEEASARGLVALESGDAAGAVGAFTQAHAALSPRGAYVTFGPPNPHVFVWHHLGRALQLTGRDREAIAMFERAAASGYERLTAPVEYGRSFYFLGQLREKQGDAAGAQQAYRRFVDLWGNGDLDRDRIAEARRALDRLERR